MKFSRVDLEGFGEEVFEGSNLSPQTWKDFMRGPEWLEIQQHLYFRLKTLRDYLEGIGPGPEELGDANEDYRKGYAIGSAREIRQYLNLPQTIFEDLIAEESRGPETEQLL